MADGFHHGKAEQFLHQRKIDALTGGARFVRHVETQDGVGAGLHDLGEQTRLRSSCVESATTTTTSGASVSSSCATRSSGENELRL
jgi:hypothetical protein